MSLAFKISPFAWSFGKLRIEAFDLGILRSNIVLFIDYAVFVISYLLIHRAVGELCLGIELFQASLVFGLPLVKLRLCRVKLCRF